MNTNIPRVSLPRAIRNMHVQDCGPRDFVRFLKAVHPPKFTTVYFGLPWGKKFTTQDMRKAMPGCFTSKGWTDGGLNVIGTYVDRLCLQHPSLSANPTFEELAKVIKLNKVRQSESRRNLRLNG